MADKPKQATPPIEITNNTQLEDIRLLLLDHTPTNYPIISDDFYFSDVELMDAMRRANEAYNALPPSTIRCGGYGIPDPYILKIGTAWQACLSKSLYFQRQKITYSAGSTQVSMYADAAEAMRIAAEQFRVEFKELALTLKRQFNIRKAHGRIG